MLGSHGQQHHILPESALGSVWWGEGKGGVGWQGGMGALPCQFLILKEREVSLRQRGSLSLFFSGLRCQKLLF